MREGFASARAELHREIGAVRSDLGGEIGGLRGEIGELRSMMFRSNIAMVVGLLGVIAAILARGA